MSFSDKTHLSLQRLKELEKLSSPREEHSGWNFLSRVKADNLFLITLITLITTLICLAFLLLTFMQDKNVREQVAKEKEKYATKEAAYLQTREIPLGNFESVTRLQTEEGMVSVVQFEAFVTTDAGRGALNEAELQMMTHKQRLRATVERVVTQSSREAFREPSLKTFRNSLVGELNEVVGSQRIQDV